MHDPLLQLYQNRLKQTSNKKVRPREFQPDSKGKWTPIYEGPCAMTLTTMDGDKLTRPMNAGAVRKYSVKKIKAR